MNDILRELREVLNPDADKEAGRVGLAERKEHLIEMLEGLVERDSLVCRKRS